MTMLIIDDLLRHVVSPILKPARFKRLRRTYIRLTDAGDQLCVEFGPRPSGQGFNSLMQIDCVFVSSVARQFLYRDVESPYPLQMLHHGEWTWSPDAPVQVRSDVTENWWNMASPAIGETLGNFLTAELVPLIALLGEPGAGTRIVTGSDQIPGRLDRS